VPRRPRSCAADEQVFGEIRDRLAVQDRAGADAGQAEIGGGHRAIQRIDLQLSRLGGTEVLQHERFRGGRVQEDFQSSRRRRIRDLVDHALNGRCAGEADIQRRPVGEHDLEIGLAPAEDPHAIPVIQARQRGRTRHAERDVVAPADAIAVVEHGERDHRPAVERDAAEGEAGGVDRVGVNAAGQAGMLDVGENLDRADRIPVRRDNEPGVRECEVGVQRFDQRVVAPRRTDDRVVAPAAGECVVAPAAAQDVGVGVADERVVVVRSRHVLETADRR
jgi:hypothetical protein